MQWLYTFKKGETNGIILNTHGKLEINTQNQQEKENQKIGNVRIR